MAVIGVIVDNAGIDLNIVLILVLELGFGGICHEMRRRLEW